MLHSKMLTFLGHGYDDAHCGHVLHGLPPSRPSHCDLCHDLDHPYGDDLSLCLCPSPDFFLYLYQIRGSDAAAKKMSRSNKQQQQSVKTGTVRQKYTLFIGQKIWTWWLTRAKQTCPVFTTIEKGWEKTPRLHLTNPDTHLQWQDVRKRCFLSVYTHTHTQSSTNNDR